MSITRSSTISHEFIIPLNMTENTVLTKGVLYNKKSDRRKEANTIPNGTSIQVFDNQCMILTDGGAIIDYISEPGYYEVVNSSVSGFFGKLKNASRQQVYYLNTKELTGIRFGTHAPISYYDQFYDAELFLRCHGTFSIRITDPVRFYEEVVSKDRDQIEVEDVMTQYVQEFLEALQVAITQMAMKGERISYLPSKATELGEYLSGLLDSNWRKSRGFEIEQVAIASISYDEPSQQVIQARNLKKMTEERSLHV